MVNVREPPYGLPVQAKRTSCPKPAQTGELHRSSHIFDA